MVLSRGHGCPPFGKALLYDQVETTTLYRCTSGAMHCALRVLRLLLSPQKEFRNRLING